MWICDACGEPIVDRLAGWVEWVNAGESGRDLRLVHHRRGCQFDQIREYARDGGTVSDSALSEFLGHDGLTSLLELVARRAVPQAEAFEMIRRLHTPNYEQARPFLLAAIREGAIEPNLMGGFFSQRQLLEVLAWAASGAGED